MTKFEQTLLDEVSALPSARRADVLAFVRYLRVSLMDDAEMEKEYDAAIQKIHETAQRSDITEKVIEEEIHALRAEHARRA